GSKGIGTRGGFGYSELPRDAADTARAAAERIRDKLRTTVEHIVHIGSDLTKAKAVLGHGRFGRWLRAEFTWSERTADNFMAVAEQFGPISEIIADLTLQPTALYLLAAPSVPDEARQEAIERAQAGERITAAVAKEIIAQWRKPEQPTPPGEVRKMERLERLLGRYSERCSPD